MSLPEVGHLTLRQAAPSAQRRLCENSEGMHKKLRSAGGPSEDGEGLDTSYLIHSHTQHWKVLSLMVSEGQKHAMLQHTYGNFIALLE